MRKIILPTAIVVVMLIAILPIGMAPIEVKASTPTLPSQPMFMDYTANPARVECWNTWQCDTPPGTVPFNVDMTDAEKVCVDGEDVYVAVLDTGLLSNYLQFFPEGMVDVVEEWGIGFSHDVYYVGSGGDWDAEGLFSYGPLHADRGFLTYDYGNPLITYYPPGGFWLAYPFGSGHGTHVASIITGWQLDRPDGTFWVRGVAPKVKLIPVLVLDDWIEFTPEGAGYWWSGGTDEMVAAGIRYIGDLAKEHGIKIVINLSLGSYSPSALEEEAIDYAIDQGVILVAAAGNEGYEQLSWPAAFPQMISTAAAGWTHEYYRYGTGDPDPWYWWIDDVPENLWTEDLWGNEFQVYLTDFSSRPNPDLGQESWHLDIAAPGAGVKGPYKPYGSGDWGYYSVWGTSQASPHAAGIAALVLDKYPNVDQHGMELCLKAAGFFNRMTKWCEKERTATIFDIFTFDLLDFSWGWNEYGTGLVQADASLWIGKFMFGRRWW